MDFSQFKRKEPKSIGSHASRLPAQVGIGLAEAATLPYNILAMGGNYLMHKGKDQLQAQAKEELKILEEKKAAGTLSPREEKYFDKVKRWAEKGPDTVRGLDVGSLIESGVEKATGVDLAPEGLAEHGIRFAAMLKNPTKLAGIGKTALESLKDPKKALQLAKQIAPTAKELEQVLESLEA